MAEARARGLPLVLPVETREEMGAGVSGTVRGRRVAVGQVAWLAPGAVVAPEVRAVARRTAVEGSSGVFIQVDGRLEGALLLADPLRAEAARTLQALRGCGIQRIYMVTGDHPDVADLVGDALGLDRVFAERSPEEKVEVVVRVREEGVTALVGDGINDAPALALADVGVAMGARGATAAAEAAGVVLAKDRLDGVLHAIRIARHTRRIALQSVLAGIGLSLVAMIAAAAGYLTPVAGAVLQEAIDVLVILNALRALGGLHHDRAPAGALAARLGHAHERLRPRIEELADLADRLEALPPRAAREALEAVQRMLETELLPHERLEQQDAFPVVARLLPGEDPTPALVGTHRALTRLARLYGRLVASLPAEGPGAADLHDLRRALYGLHAILALHFDQEDELYSLLDADGPG
jgi:soluble P-type ATPase